MVCISVGTFFAQATATGFVGRMAAIDRATASGLYLACYFLGGIAGTFALGQLFDRFGWAACVAGIGTALAVAALLAAGIVEGPAARGNYTGPFAAGKRRLAWKSDSTPS
jgi:hypothetical protein